MLTRSGYDVSAVKAYCAIAAKNYEVHEVCQAGIFVDMEKPHISATPDGLMRCTCYGKGVLKVMCPFCIKDCLPENEGAIPY